MVAGGGELSEPDEVRSWSARRRRQASRAVVPSARRPSPSPVQLRPRPSRSFQPHSQGYPREHGGSDVGDVLDAIAHRRLYESFAMLQSELAHGWTWSSRLTSPRAAWVEGVFSPLEAYTTSQLLAAGLDVRQPQGIAQPLTSPRKRKCEIILKGWRGRSARARRRGERDAVRLGATGFVATKFPRKGDR